MCGVDGAWREFQDAHEDVLLRNDSRPTTADKRLVSVNAPKRLRILWRSSPLHVSDMHMQPSLGELTESTQPGFDRVEGHARPPRPSACDGPVVDVLPELGVVLEVDDDAGLLTLVVHDEPDAFENRGSGHLLNLLWNPPQYTATSVAVWLTPSVLLRWEYHQSGEAATTTPPTAATH